MSVQPIAEIDVDLIDLYAVRDMAPALVDYLRMIRSRQHALMSAWGGPAVCRSLGLTSSGSTTWTVTVRVPPGVTDLGLALLCHGSAIITITTAADATGTELRSVAPNDAGAETPTWVSTGTVAPSSAGASSGRAVTVLSSASWTWSDVDLSIAVADVSSVGLLAIETRPVHVAR